MRFRKKRILVTDDGKGLLLKLSVALKRMGFNVIPAENCAESVRLAGIMPPDLILLDIDPIAGADGYSAYCNIKDHRDTTHIPVVITYSEGTADLATQCGMAGCSGFLAKPVAIETLHGILQEHLFTPFGQTRIHLRVAYAGKVEIGCAGRTEELYCRTISSGGLYLGRPEPLPVGSDVTVSIATPDSKPIHVNGSVIYVTAGGETVPSGMAVEFRDITQQQADRLEAFVKSLIGGIRDGRLSG